MSLLFWCSLANVVIMTKPLDIEIELAENRGLLHDELHLLACLLLPLRFLFGSLLLQVLHLDLEVALHFIFTVAAL